jgi:hypothetical protein
MTPLLVRNLKPEFWSFRAQARAPGNRSVAVRGNLEAQVRTFLAEHPTATWDAALRQIACAGG